MSVACSAGRPAEPRPATPATPGADCCTTTTSVQIASVCARRQAASPCLSGLWPVRLPPASARACRAAARLPAQPAPCIDARTHRHSHTTHLHAARACPHTALIHRPHASTFARISPLHRFFGFEAFPCVDTGTMTRTSTLKKEEKLKLRALQLRPGPSKRAQWLLLVLGLDPSRSIWGLKPYDLKWPGRDSEAWFQQV